MRMSEYYNLPDFDPTFLTDAKIKHYVSLMQQKYISHWQHTIRNSKKQESPLGILTGHSDLPHP